MVRRLLELEARTTEHAIDTQFRDDVIAGLSLREKTLHCKYFYDERGSELFDEICELDEYYLTRAETAIIERHAPEMAEQLGPRVMLVEFGSGSSTKTRILLEHLIDPAAYVPIDISEEHLFKTAADLREQFPHLEILPVAADFTKSFALPTSRVEPTHAAVFFPGSTIGNFKPTFAVELLDRIARGTGPGGELLIGVDLQKDPAVIEAAYNDARGVTAAFTLNLLDRANRELGANFDLGSFGHEANYNRELGRIETYIVSHRDQTVDVAGKRFAFAEGERMFTEYSHKYTVEGFAEIAASVGFSLRRHWTDPDDLFAVLDLVVDAP